MEFKTYATETVPTYEVDRRIEETFKEWDACRKLGPADFQHDILQYLARELFVFHNKSEKNWPEVPQDSWRAEAVRMLGALCFIRPAVKAMICKPESQENT